MTGWYTHVVNLTKMLYIIHIEHEPDGQFSEWWKRYCFDIFYSFIYLLIYLHILSVANPLCCNMVRCV